MFRRANHAPLGAALALALMAACTPDAAPPVAPAPHAPVATEIIADPGSLQDFVSRAHAKYDVIALGAIVASRDGTVDEAVAGYRTSKSEDPALLTDTWHLGSNTKALTALLYAQLVERGHAEWGATLPDLFPDLGDAIDPAWQSVTIEDLFAHRTGLAQKGGFWLNARRRDDRPVPEQRYAAAQAALAAPPRKDPSAFDYNNLNYIIAGSAIEQILQTQPDLPDTWEAAMQALLFDKLSHAPDRSGFGFGPPQEGLEGHRSLFNGPANPVGRGKAADNPRVLGPAGTLHATLSAHAALAIEFLREDSALMSPATREKLFAPYPDAESTYAMGWGISIHSDYGTMYLHNGSNTMWLSQIVIAPDLDRVVIVNVNQFDDAARAAVQDVTREVLAKADAEQQPQ